MTNHFARHRRENATASEGLLWSVLRGKQVSDLKFRREHTIGPWTVDFACIAKSLVVEIDGDYHDATQERDLQRQADLERRGWKVIRFKSQDVEQDTEAVAKAIAADAGVEYVFTGRMKTGSGQLNVRAKPPKPKNE